MKKFIFVFLCFVSVQASAITLEQLFKQNIFHQKTVSGFVSMKNGRNYTIMKDNKIIIKDFLNPDRQEVFFDAGKFEIQLSGYLLDKKEESALIFSEKESIYRRSYKSKCYVFNKKNTSITNIIDDKGMYCKFSPNGKAVSYVKDNNIFIWDVATAKTEQITTDGTINKIINGAVDWVYEEEFSLSDGLFWSHDGKKIAYYKFDESVIKPYYITNYRAESYPEFYKYKYPKSGEDNSEVSVHIYDFETQKDLKINLKTGQDFYIPRIKWGKTSDFIFIQYLNRKQNHLEYLKIDIKTGKVLAKTSDDNKWYVDIKGDWEFLEEDKKMIFRSSKDGYSRAYLHDFSTSETKPITQEKHDITKLHGYDPTTKNLFYSSVSQNGKGRILNQTNISDNQTKTLREENGWHNTIFTKNFKYYLDYHSTLNTPQAVSLYETSKNKKKRILEDNYSLKQKLSEHKYLKKEFFEFYNRQGDKLLGTIVKPENFDKTKQYPVIFIIYGGPGTFTQTVVDRWQGTRYTLYPSVLADMGYVVVSVDNRGTPGRGDEFLKKHTYKSFGQADVEDQIDAVKYLTSLGYVDKNRIGIYGWSYGGYMTLMCMTKGNEYFNVGVAGAPVSSWRYYDNVYTERFMDKPENNPSGYKQGNVSNFLDRLKGKLMIIHGLSDDNVHPQNSFEVIRKLIDLEIDHDMLIIPNEDHGIDSQYFLYKKITTYFRNNL